MSGNRDVRPLRLELANRALNEKHYLGASGRGFALHDDAGILVFANPSSRRLPQDWLELVRWCLIARTPNAGSNQWARVAAWLRTNRPEASTVVSYSDPSAGHLGALYRSCNWLWAPTWHRLRPPPTGNGDWGRDEPQATKDRWVYPLGPDPRRAELLSVNDSSVLKSKPWASYREPPAKYGRIHRTEGGGDFKRFLQEACV